MQLPKRPKEEMKRMNQTYDHHLTQDKIERLRRDLERLLKTERPEAIAETQRLAEMGDFSENVGYQVAKAHLRRINNRITSIEERLKSAIPIELGSRDGRVHIGSTVVLESDGESRTYQILGSQETDPTRGRISHLSPLGSGLLGCVEGNEVELDSGKVFKVVEVM